jgi:hypothetical protein
MLKDFYTIIGKVYANVSALSEHILPGCLTIIEVYEKSRVTCISVTGTDSLLLWLRRTHPIPAEKLRIELNNYIAAASHQDK